MLEVKVGECQSHAASNLMGDVHHTGKHAQQQKIDFGMVWSLTMLNANGYSVQSMLPNASMWH